MGEYKYVFLTQISNLLHSRFCKFQCISLSFLLSSITFKGGEVVQGAPPAPPVAESQNYGPVNLLLKCDDIRNRSLTLVLIQYLNFVA